MKKLLLLILIVLLCTAAYMLAFKNIEIGTLKTTNLEELEALDKELRSDIDKARELNETTYATKINELNSSIKRLTTSKETYAAKINSLSEDVDLGIVAIKKYKIEYLWTKLENYAKDNGVWIKLDLLENGGEDVYDLDITLKGSYIDITEVIFDIEKDDTLDFTVEEFKIVPSSTTTTTTTTTNTPTLPNDSGTITPSDANNTNNNSTNNTSSNTAQTVVVDASVLQATFTIKNVNIELD